MVPPFPSPPPQFLGSFLISCGCSAAKSGMSLHRMRLFPPLNGTEHGSQPSLTTRDRELVSVLEVRIEPGDLNQRPLTPQSVDNFFNIHLTKNVIKHKNVEFNFRMGCIHVLFPFL